MVKKDEIQIKWSWKVFFIILFLGLWLWTAYGSSNLREDSKDLLNDYNNLVDKYNVEVKQNTGKISIEACNNLNDLQSPCGEGNTIYCYRADYNVGACLNNERVVCQK